VDKRNHIHFTLVGTQLIGEWNLNRVQLRSRLSHVVASSSANDAYAAPERDFVDAAITP